MNVSKVDNQNIIKLRYVPEKLNVFIAIKPGRYLSISDLVYTIEKRIFDRSAEMKQNGKFASIVNAEDPKTTESVLPEMKKGIRFEYVNFHTSKSSYCETCGYE